MIQTVKETTDKEEYKFWNKESSLQEKGLRIENLQDIYLQVDTFTR